MDALPRNMADFREVIEEFADVANYVRTPKKHRGNSQPPQNTSATVPKATPDTSPVATPVKSDAAARATALKSVYAAFDLDGGGDVGAEELMELGIARRKLGQKQGTWSVDQNNRLMAKIDMDGDGVISESEFINFFTVSLPGNMAEFMSNIEQFREVAATCSAKKTSHTPSDKPEAGSSKSVSQSRISSPSSGDLKKALSRILNSADLGRQGVLTRMDISQLGPIMRSLVNHLDEQDGGDDATASEEDFVQYGMQALPAWDAEESEKQLKELSEAAARVFQMKRDERHRYRLGQLQDVFREFDVDRSGINML